MLRFNDIGGEGGTAISDALPSCTALRQLVLRGNSLGDDAGVAIATAVNKSSLELLDLSSCDLSEHLHLPSLTCKPAQYVVVAQICRR